MRVKTYSYTLKGKHSAWDVSQSSRGFGDTIAKVTHAVGIDRTIHALGVDCGDCKERQKKLNELFPYRG